MPMYFMPLGYWQEVLRDRKKELHNPFFSYLSVKKLYGNLFYPFHFLSCQGPPFLMKIIILNQSSCLILNNDGAQCHHRA